MTRGRPASFPLPCPSPHAVGCFRLRFLKCPTRQQPSWVRRGIPFGAAPCYSPPPRQLAKEGFLPLSMYQASVPVFLQMLTALSAILDKAAEHARTNGIDPAE